MKASKIKTTITILLILWIALFAPVPPAQPVAMKRESRIVLEGEIVEGRSILVNQGSYTWILEV